MSSADMSDAEDGMDQLAIHDDEEEDEQQHVPRSPPPPPAASRVEGMQRLSSSDEDSSDDDEPEPPVDLVALNEWVEQLTSPDRAVVAAAAQGIRRLVSFESNPPIQQVINAGAVPLLASLMDRSDDEREIQFEAAWALTNITSGTTAQTQTVVDAGALLTFVRLLTSSHEDVSDQAAWAIANIAGDSIALRDACISAGALDGMLNILCQDAIPLSMLQNIAAALSNFTRDRPQPEWRLIQPCVPLAVELIEQCEDKDVLSSLTWFLAYVSDDPTPDHTQRSEVCRYGALPHLVRLLSHDNAQVRIPALRALANIVAGPDRLTLVAINSGMLPPVVALLSDPRPNTRREAAWLLSNCSDHVWSMIRADVFPALSAAWDDRPEVKRQVAWALANALGGCLDQQRPLLLQQGVVTALCRLLCTTPDSQTNEVAVRGLADCMRNARRQARREAKPELLQPYITAAREADLPNKLAFALAQCERILMRDTSSMADRDLAALTQLGERIRRLLRFFDDRPIDQQWSGDDEEEESDAEADEQRAGEQRDEQSSSEEGEFDPKENQTE